VKKYLRSIRKKRGAAREAEATELMMILIF
jgi:hypothetical protein